VHDSVARRVFTRFDGYAKVDTLCKNIKFHPPLQIITSMGSRSRLGSPDNDVIFAIDAKIFC
jgi:hypothetical protein